MLEQDSAPVSNCRSQSALRVGSPNMGSTVSSSEQRRGRRTHASIVKAQGLQPHRHPPLTADFIAGTGGFIHYHDRAPQGSKPGRHGQPGHSAAHDQDLRFDTHGIPAQ